MPPGLRGSFSIAFLRSSRCRSTIDRSFAASGVPAATPLSSCTVGAAAFAALSPVIDARPSERIAGRDACANGARRSRKRVSCGAAASSCRSAGVCWSATLPSDFIVGWSCSRNPGSFRRPEAICGRRSADACAVSFALTTKRPTSLRLAARSPTTLSALTVRSARSWFCSPRSLSVRSVSRSAGIARRIAAFSSGPRPATPAPSSETMIRSRPPRGRARPLALRLAQDVVDEVGRDRRGGLRDRDPRARLELLPCRAGQAVEVVLADERLRARLAVHVAAQRAEAALVDAEADERVLRAAVELDVGDLPGAHARDLEVAALDEPEGVVELDPVGVPLAAAEPGRQHDVRAQRGDEREDDERALHLPSGSWAASHGKSAVGL